MVEPVKIHPLSGARAKKVPEPVKRTRVAWSANLSDEELRTEGGILLAMLISRANELGHTLKEMSEELGVTYGYIAQLRSGRRLIENVSDAFADRSALYLNVPRLTVLMAAGRVRADDIFKAAPNLFMEVPAAMAFIQRDPEYGPWMPASFLSMTPREQLFLVRLYEKASGRRLLSIERIDEHAVAVAMAELEEYRAFLREHAEHSARAAEEAESEEID